MSVHKDKERKTWYVCVRYTDWQGNRRMKKKRGFSREKDAKEWEREFLRTAGQKCDMSFASLSALYLEDMRSRLRENTMATKEHIFQTKLLPYFGKQPMEAINSVQIRRWQTELMKQGFSPTYLKTIQNQLSAVFNYAVMFYNLPNNPVRAAGSLGKGSAEGMRFWTPEEFKAVVERVPALSARVGLSILFWTGLRIGELLALSPADFDLGKGELHVTKSFQLLGGKEVITEPKTPKSKRAVPMPEKLCAEVREFLGAIYEPAPDARLFPFGKQYFHKQMQKACDALGVEKIRLHDLRHSYASMLINSGAPVLLVSELLGHEKIETTLGTYGHLYKEVKQEAVSKLNELM